MSLYTTEVRYICEDLAGYDESQGYKKVNDIIEAAAPEIFDGNFPIFDESYRLILESKILKHYYTREIGFETVGLWQLKLNTKMEEIMPFYNQLYNSELIEFNPLYTTNLYKTYDKTGSETGNKTEDEQERGSDHRTREDSEDKTQNGIESKTGNSDLVKNKSGEGGSETTESYGNAETGNALRNTTSSETGGGSLIRDEAADATTDSSEVNSTNGWNKYSDTPQGGLSNVANGSYLTTATNTTDDTTKNSSEAANTHNTVGEQTDTHSQTAQDESSTENKITQGNKEQSRQEHETGQENETRNENGTVISNSDAAGHRNEDEQTTTDKNKTKQASDTRNNLENYLEHVVGWQGHSPSKLLQELRETFLNIDMMIIDELSDLFMGLWA